MQALFGRLAIGGGQWGGGERQRPKPSILLLGFPGLKTTYLGGAR